MSIDPNHDLNPVFADDQGDAFSSPEEDDDPGTDIGNPDMRDVVRREPPGMPPAGAVDRVVDDRGVSLPNAGRADRVGDLESATARAVVPEERRGSEPDPASPADIYDGGSADDEVRR
jgi:hypothetical protein